MTQMIDSANSAVKSIFFGLILSCVIVISSLFPEVRISPFQSTVLALLSASLLTVAAFFMELLNCDKLSRTFFMRVIATGLLVAVGLFFVLLGLQGPQSLLASMVILCSTPVLSIIFRKFFWDEALLWKQKFGILLVLVCMAIWMLLPIQNKFSFRDTASLFQVNAAQMPQMLQIGQYPMFLFFGTLFWSAAFAVTRPSQCNVTTGVYWSWSLLAAALIGIPLMILGNQHIQGDKMHVILPLLVKKEAFVFGLVFGAGTLFSRVFLLAKSSSVMATSTMSFLWVFTCVFSGLLVSGNLKARMDLLHFVSLIGFLWGVYLSRSSSRDWKPFFGLREVH